MVLTRAQRRQMEGLKQVSKSGAQSQRPARRASQRIPAETESRRALNARRSLTPKGSNTRTSRVIPATMPVRSKSRTQSRSSSVEEIPPFLLEQKIGSANDAPEIEPTQDSSRVKSTRSRRSVRTARRRKSDVTFLRSKQKLKPKRKSDDAIIAGISKALTTLPTTDGGSNSLVWASLLCLLLLATLLWTVHTSLPSESGDKTYALMVVYLAAIDTLVTVFTVFGDYRAHVMCTEAVSNVAILFLFLLVSGNNVLGLVMGSAAVNMLSLYFQLTRGGGKDEVEDAKDEYLVRTMAYVPVLVSVAISYELVLEDVRLLVFAGCWLLSYFIDVFEIPDRWLERESVVEALTAVLRAVAVYTLVTSRILYLFPTKSGMTSVEFDSIEAIRKGFESMRR